MKKPLVSVVMITYGHENFITQAINGVLMQECDFEVELIIANDCSTDATDEVIKEIIKNDSKSAWIKYTKHEKNIGMMPNFIFALQEAQGKYIALCEGDDYWTDPLKLQKQVDFLEVNEDYSLVFTAAEVIIEKVDIDIGININLWENKDYKGDEILKNWLIPTASILFRNNLLKNYFVNSGNGDIIYGDILLFLTLADFGKIRCINEKTCVYRRNNTGVSVLNPINGKVAINHYKALNKIFNYKYNKILITQMAIVHLNVAIIKIINNNLFGVIDLCKSIFKDYKVFLKYLVIKIKK